MSNKDEKDEARIVLGAMAEAGDFAKGLRVKFRDLSTEAIIKAIYAIGSNHVGMARECLLEVYREREGQDAADRFRKEIGF